MAGAVQVCRLYVHFCLHVGWQVGGGWSDQGKDETAVLIRDQWVGNSEYCDCLDPTAMGSWERVLRKRVA